MLNSAGRVLLTALRDILERRLGSGHDCWLATDRALAEGDAAAAQRALNSLDPAMLGEVMAEAHKALREDPALILEAWKSTVRGH